MGLGTVIALAALASAPLTAEDYAHSSGQVTLPDGRVMQLTCRGEDSDTTIILLAGLGDWSMTWSDLHDDFAARKRTCAIDRPGFGLSGAASGGELSAIVNDYRSALAARDISGPWIIAGHSFGGLEALRWANDHPDEVVGLLQIDSSVPGQIALASEEVPIIGQIMRSMFANAEQTDRQCAERGQELSQAEPDDRCISAAIRPGLPDGVAAAMATLARDPVRYERRADMIAQFASPTDSEFEENLGSIQVISLIAGKPTELPPGLPDAAVEAAPEFDTVIRARNTEIAGWSTAGEARVVPGSGHYIHRDRPDAVRAAMAQLVWRVDTAD